MLRCLIFKPYFSQAVIMRSRRSGWRGTIIVKSSGCSFLRCLCRRQPISSSGSCVLAISQIGRLPILSFKRVNSISSTGRRSALYFKLPDTSTLRIPRALNDSASSSVCVRQTEKIESKSSIPLRAFCQRLSDFSDRRALISAAGILRSPIAANIFGQISDSIQSATSGFQ